MDLPQPHTTAHATLIGPGTTSVEIVATVDTVTFSYSRNGKTHHVETFDRADGQLEVELSRLVEVPEERETDLRP
ncbi:MAG: hypothetical protein U0Q22_03620 [Acidimicrobiales bacterium]